MLSRLKNGQYRVKTEAEAIEAMNAVRALRDEIQDLMIEHGITEMMEDSTELKKAATAWAVKSDTKTFDLGGGIYVRLRQDKYGGEWIATDDDLTSEIPPGVISLRVILRRKFKRNPEKFKEIWNRVTKRTVDPDALKRVIDEGELTAEDVAPAFTEKDKAPFLMIYGEK